MGAFVYEIIINLKMNFRNKEILVHYYLVPLIFYIFIGNIFMSINPLANETIIQVMVVFGITMAGVLGSPYPLVEFYGTEIKKSYQVGQIPLWTVAVGNVISGFIHIFIMSMIIFLTAPFLLNATIPINLINYLIFLILLIISSLFIGMVFGLYFKSSSKMTMATQLVFLPSIMLSRIMFPVDILPKALQKISKIFPATWGYKGMVENEIKFENILPLLIIIFFMVILGWIKLKNIKRE